MNPQAFNLLLLPPEIRLEIYLLATPPRIVHVKEALDENYEDFVEEIRTNLNRLRIDSSLAHFAFNWRRHVSGLRWQQQKLETFGFTNSKPRYQPWSPSTSSPEISIDWLDENPEIAWEFARNSHFYSNAPIPTLLHLCQDSRAMLMYHGYQLAFCTRSSQPRTWFHFDRDSLFVRKACHDPWSRPVHEILSANSWELGQFHPADMCMVRNLALAESSILFSPVPEQHGLSQIEPIIQLFPQLNELRLVEWSNEDARSWVLGSPMSYPKEHIELQRRLDREPWVYREVEETDALLLIFPSNNSEYPAFKACGLHGYCLIKYKKENGPEAPYFKDAGIAMEKALAGFMESAIIAKEIDPNASWRVPKILISHVLSASVDDYLHKERLVLKEDLRDMKEQWISARNQSGAIGGMSSGEVNSAEAFAKLHWSEPHTEGCRNCDGWCVEVRMRSAFTKWWIQESSDV